MHLLLYKSFLKKIAALLLGAIALGSVPVIPATNGVISVAVFRDNKTHQLQYYEMSDSQLDLMNMQAPGGEAYNPAGSTTATWIKSYQYPAGQSPLATASTASATSSPTVAAPDPTANFKDNDSISALQLIAKTPLIQHAYAAIARDATSSSGVITATSQTWAHTVTGSNPVLFVFGKVRSTTATNLQLMTYNGTQMATTTTVASYNDAQWAWMMHLANPATGTHNIVARFDSSLSTTFAAVDYTGGAQSGIPDSSATDGGGTGSNNYSQSTTAVASNSWLLLANVGLDGTCSGVTGQGLVIDRDNPVLADSNGTVSTGSQSISVTGCGLRVENKIIISFAPFVAAAAGQTSTQMLMANDF